MRGPIVILSLALSTLPASAQGSNHKWIQSGTENGLVDCVDQNSIVKNADGTIQYEELYFCKGADDDIRVNIVNCNQDMSGKQIIIRGRPYNPGKDGKYYFGDEPTDSTTMPGQSAKFVCHK